MVQKQVLTKENTTQENDIMINEERVEQKIKDERVKLEIGKTGTVEHGVRLKSSDGVRFVIVKIE